MENDMIFNINCQRNSMGNVLVSKVKKRSVLTTPFSLTDRLSHLHMYRRSFWWSFWLLYFGHFSFFWLMVQYNILEEDCKADHNDIKDCLACCFSELIR